MAHGTAARQLDMARRIPSLSQNRKHAEAFYLNTPYI
jgi:hypothetical protein